jgi:protein involved in temperature-dependent protein secretion
MGRKTDWQQQDDGTVIGRGAKMYLAGEKSLALFEWRELVIDPVAGHEAN